MRKISLLLIVWILCGAITACSYKGKTDNVDIDYGESEKYGKEELEIAANLIFEDFKSYKNCELIRLRYSEEDSQGWGSESNNETIVFIGDFVTGKSPPEGALPDYEYSWKWILEKEDSKSEWKIVNVGQG